MRKLAILLLALLMLFTPVLAEDTLVEGICEYVLTNEGVIITQFYLDENATDVIVIPAELGGMPVIDIAEGSLTYYWGEIALRLLCRTSPMKMDSSLTRKPAPCFILHHPLQVSRCLRCVDLAQDAPSTG